MQVNNNKSSNEVSLTNSSTEPLVRQDEKKTIPAVPGAKREIVPKIHRQIKTLLKEHKISKWDEVEVFYGLIEKWVGTMIKTKRAFSKMDLLLLGSHHDIIEKSLWKQVKEREEK